MRNHTRVFVAETASNPTNPLLWSEVELRAYVGRLRVLHEVDPDIGAHAGGVAV